LLGVDSAPEAIGLLIQISSQKTPQIILIWHLNAEPRGSARFHPDSSELRAFHLANGKAEDSREGFDRSVRRFRSGSTRHANGNASYVKRLCSNLRYFRAQQRIPRFPFHLQVAQK
jgi:hypothetical protein